MNFHSKYKKVSPWWRFFTAEFRMVYNHTEQTNIIGYEFEDKHVKLEIDGKLTIKGNTEDGFVFGASGPTIDWLPFGIFRKQLKSQRRGVCKHDAGYYISDHGIFKGPKSKMIKEKWDRILYDDFMMDGGIDERVETWDFFVDHFGFMSWESGQ